MNHPIDANRGLDCLTRLRWLTAAFFLAATLLTCSPVAVGQEAGNNPVQAIDFEGLTVHKLPKEWETKGLPGFKAFVTDDSARTGKLGLRLKRTEAARTAPVGMARVPLDLAQCRGKRIRVRASVKADLGENSHVQMFLKEDLKSGDIGAMDDGSGHPIASGDWKDHAVVADISEDSKKVVVGFLLFGSGTFFADDLVVEIVDETVALTTKDFDDLVKSQFKGRDGLFEIKGAMDVRVIAGRKAKENDDEFRLLIPLPLVHGSQIPLTYNLETNPPQALKSFKIYQDKPNNYVADVRLTPQDGKDDIRVQFNAAVLVRPESFDQLPEKAPIPNEWPNEARPWLAATWCVDSEHEAIRKMAEEIRAETNDVLQIISKVEKSAQSVFSAASGQVDNLTAVEALEKRGSCTSCGNLVAALLRASDVPARVLSGYPSWSGPLQTHYIVEAYVPDFGWYPIESTLCRSPWPNKNQINVSVIYPEYESKKLASFRTGIAGGVPYLSLTESPGNNGDFVTTGAIPDAEYCDHVCNFLKEYKAESESWETVSEWATQRWSSWLDSSPTIDQGRIQFGPAAMNLNAANPTELMAELKSWNAAGTDSDK